MDAFTDFARLLIVFLFALIFGLQRQKSHKPIGFGTYIFVSTGACVLALAATYLAPQNPLPLLSAIVTGIGFLGAGALIKSTDKVFGFTSAATIWFFAILGLTIGIGEYFLGFMAYLIVWAVFGFDYYLEKHSIGSYQKKITVTTNKLMNEAEIKKMLAEYTKKYRLVESTIDKKNSKMILIYNVEGSKNNLNLLPIKLHDKDWFESCRIE